MRRSVRELGRYRPVMLAQYADDWLSTPVFENDLRNLLTDDAISELVASGLFAWSAR